MALKKLRPTSPGQRFRIAPAFDEITASTPEKSLLAPLKNSGGRNNSGKMSNRYIGGGHKAKYRIIDFKRDKASVPATVKTIEYDPNRTARIALLQYADGEKRYIIAPAGVDGRCDRLCRVRALLRKLAMPYHCAKFRSVPSYTISS